MWSRACALFFTCSYGTSTPVTVSTCLENEPYTWRDVFSTIPQGGMGSFPQTPQLYPQGLDPGPIVAEFEILSDDLVAPGDLADQPWEGGVDQRRTLDQRWPPGGSAQEGEPESERGS